VRPRPTYAASGVEEARDIAGRTLDGDAVAVAVTAVEHDTLLAFLSTGCATCEPFWTALRAGVDVPGDARLVVVTQDHESESRLRDLAAPGLEVLASDAAWEAYGVPGSPHFVYVDGRSGRVTGEGTAPDWPAVRDLLAQAVADRRARATTTTRVPQDVEWRDNPSRVDVGAEVVQRLEDLGVAAQQPGDEQPEQGDRHPLGDDDREHVSAPSRSGGASARGGGGPAPSRPARR
jgi:hypothetical protein